MPVIPQIPRPKRSFLSKRCARCQVEQPEEDFAFTHSKFYPDYHLPLCNSCVTLMLREHDFDWGFIDKLCQWADIPFIVKEWERLRELNSPDSVWAAYSKVFASQDYEGLGWDTYFKQYQELKAVGLVEEEIPLLKEKHFDELRARWGANYDEEALDYLENLYQGLLMSQNVVGALQIDQAQKLCKVSYEIDSRIRAGDKDVDKFMATYDKLVKTAEFTPKNIKNARDFDSFGELALWLEKRGNQNKFYDGATRDVIDETIKNIQAWNQRLYVNESSLSEEITARLQALKNVQESENFYETEQKDFDADLYEAEVFKDEDNEDFETEGEMGI